MTTMRQVDTMDALAAAISDVGNENSCPYGGHSPAAGSRCRYCGWVTPRDWGTIAARIVFGVLILGILALTAAAMGTAMKTWSVTTVAAVVVWFVANIFGPEWRLVDGKLRRIK